MIQLFQHPPFPDDIPHAFGPYDCNSSVSLHLAALSSIDGLTLIFPDIFQSKSQPGIFALHDPDFPKGTFSHHPQQSEVVEID